GCGFPLRGQANRQAARLCVCEPSEQIAGPTHTLDRLQDAACAVGPALLVSQPLVLQTRAGKGTPSVVPAPEGVEADVLPPASAVLTARNESTASCSLFVLTAQEAERGDNCWFCFEGRATGILWKASP